MWCVSLAFCFSTKNPNQHTHAVPEQMELSDALTIRSLLNICFQNYLREHTRKQEKNRVGRKLSTRCSQLCSLPQHHPSIAAARSHPLGVSLSVSTVNWELATLIPRLFQLLDYCPIKRSYSFAFDSLVWVKDWYTSLDNEPSSSDLVS